jgi:hypothetical protein
MRNKMDRHLFYSVIVIIIFGLYCFKNIRQLKIALQFHRAIKTRNYIRCSAEITEAHGAVNRSYYSRKAAKAKYMVKGKQFIGEMICSYDSHVDVNDTVTVIIPKDNMYVFAFSEKQVQDAVMTYVVFTILLAIGFIALSTGLIYLYIP